MIVDTVMAMAISYYWLFLWHYTFYFDGVFLVLITGITRALTVPNVISNLTYFIHVSKAQS